MIDRTQANIMTEKPTYEELEQKVKKLDREIEKHEEGKKEFAAKEEGYRGIIETIADSYDDALYEVKAKGRNNYLLKECKS